MPQRITWRRHTLGQKWHIFQLFIYCRHHRPLSLFSSPSFFICLVLFVFSLFFVLYSLCHFTSLFTFTLRPLSLYYVLPLLLPDASGSVHTLVLLPLTMTVIIDVFFVHLFFLSPWAPTQSLKFQPLSSALALGSLRSSCSPPHYLCRCSSTHTTHTLAGRINFVPSPATDCSGPIRFRPVISGPNFWLGHSSLPPSPLPLLDQMPLQFFPRRWEKTPLKNGSAKSDYCLHSRSLSALALALSLSVCVFSYFVSLSLAPAHTLVRTLRKRRRGKKGLWRGLREIWSGYYSKERKEDSFLARPRAKIDSFLCFCAP